MSDQNGAAAPEATNAPVIEKVEMSTAELASLLDDGPAFLTGDEGSKNGILGKNKPDMTIFDNNGPDDEEDDDPAGGGGGTSNLTDVLDDDLSTTEEEEEEEPNPPAPASSVTMKAVSDLVEEGILDLFVTETGELEKPLAEYTDADLKELISSNIQNKMNEVAEAAPLELFGTMPEEAKAVVAYALGGGTDLKSLFTQLANSQDVFELDPANVDHQEKIVRKWYELTNEFTPEEIENEITILKDKGDLADYAVRYKPKVDAKESDQIQKRIKDQQETAARKDEVAKKYHDQIYATLNKADLNGIPLNNAMRTQLYHGILNNKQFQNSEGKPINALGYHLEQKQFGKEADPALVLEVLFLLENPVEYRKAIRSISDKEANARILGKLKTEEASKGANASTIADESGKTTIPRKGVKRGESGKSTFLRRLNK